MRDDIIADGLRYIGDDGSECWLTGSQLLAHIRQGLSSKADRKVVEQLAKEIGRDFATLRAQVRRLEAEVKTLRTAQATPRIVGGKDAA